jgi:NAD(P)-dependent dehydrogenase (short-subunit alcohol dehydrogenase family)
MAAAACADITDEQAVAAAVNELCGRLGTADILINNAGLSGPIGPAWDVPLAEWWRAIELNLGGAFVLTQLALAHMVAEGRGRIINITSYAGVHRWPLMSAYAASKAALVKLTETLAHEARPHGVSVFSVDPGLLRIGLSEAALSGTADQQTPADRVHRWIRGQFDAGRGADPEKAVRLILALASGKADRLSGCHLRTSDNLGALLARIDEIERHDLHTLRLRTGM